ncbi:MAG: antitoxin family protein [Armatimonadota bacterium]
MPKVITAVYEQGVFKPLEPVDLPEGKQVQVFIPEPTPEEILQTAARVYEGLTEEEIEKIERIALDRSNFMRPFSEDLLSEGRGGERKCL